jgi:hypothetical protein
MFLDLGDFEIINENFKDFYELKIIIWICLTISVLFNLLQLFLIFQRKNLQPLKGRGSHIMYLFLLGQVIVYYVPNMRISTNRNDFSCIIYTLVTFLGSHGIFNNK